MKRVSFFSGFIILAFLFFATCDPTVVKMKNSFRIYDIQPSTIAKYPHRFEIVATYDNYTDSPAYVRGTISWGDGSGEAFDETAFRLMPYGFTSPGVSQGEYGSWRSSPVYHAFPGPGTYRIEVRLSGFFVTGPLESEFAKNFEVKPPLSPIARGR